MKKSKLINKGHFHPAYFETQFKLNQGSIDYTKNMAIITAFATTGENWSDERNQKQNKLLENKLIKDKLKYLPIIGFSPTSNHQEPSFICEVDFDSACDLGKEFLQDAIYYIQNGQLYVSFCDERRTPVLVGEFKTRMHYLNLP